MSSGIPDPVLRNRAWLMAALVFGAMLVVPFLGWLILPAPPAISIPTVAAATEEPAPRPARKPIESTPAPARTSAPEPVASAGVVHGRVIGPDRAPIMRAWIGCADKDVNTVTEPDGSFDLPGEADGCSAIARKPGFGASQPVTLRSNNDRANTLTLRAGGRIEGSVVDEQGAPIPKFMLAVEKFIGSDGDDEGSNGRARTVENEKGEFTMENATPGKYVLSVSVEGRPPARSNLFDVESGRAATGVRITVAKGAALKGTITDAATRKAIAGARVELDSVTSSGVSSIPSVTTDESGAYALEGAPTGGPFSIRVTKGGYRTRIVSGLSARGATPMTADVQLVVKGEGSGESEFGGIGAILGPNPDSLGAVVLATTKDGPAERAGLTRMDRIVRIDSAPAESLTLMDCIQRLRGEPGTKVAIWVKRGEQELQFNVTRETVVR